MNMLAKRRTDLNLTQPEVSTALRRADKRMDTGMISRFERGACLPTPPVMEMLETVLQASRFELYSYDDIDLVDMSYPEEETEEVPPVKPKRKEIRFRKCYRIPRQFAESLPDDLLAVCGYNSWQSWHDAALKRLLGEYAARKKAINKREAQR